MSIVSIIYGSRGGAMPLFGHSPRDSLLAYFAELYITLKCLLIFLIRAWVRGWIIFTKYNTILTPKTVNILKSVYSNVYRFQSNYCSYCI
jgi:hypothetical protein